MKWHIMRRIVGMLSFRQAAGGLNALEPPIEVLMISRFIRRRLVGQSRVRCDHSTKILTMCLGQPLDVRETLKEPRKTEFWAAETQKKTFGPTFRKDAQAVQAAVDALSEELRYVKMCPDTIHSTD
jgi:glycyl-tRNA synthetase (class II)